MSLTEFRASFRKFVENNGFKLPDFLINSSDVEFTAGVNQVLRPYENDMDLCLSNLKTVITIAGHELPDLNAEQEKKLKRYLDAFIKSTA